MKKLISILLILLLSVCSMPALAEADSLDFLKSIWFSYDQHYYQQLSPEHQAAWATDIANVLYYPNQTPAAARDVRHQALASMIKHDNPRIFWIDWIDSYGRLRFDTGSEGSLDCFQLPEGQTLADLQMNFLRGIDAAVAQIKATLPENADMRTRARAIRDWICANNTYNDAQVSANKKQHDPVLFDYLAAHSAYSAMIPGDAYEPVCEGYAGAFKVLCDAFGVPSRCVSGSASFASAHMWNIVQLEDANWYMVDLTGDDANNTDYFFLKGTSLANQYAYTFRPYLNSGVNPSNGYTEGAAFTIPEIIAD